MEFLFVIIILLMSVVIHEVSHGFAALALGDPTAKYQGRLTLNPLSHIDFVGSILVPFLGWWSGGFLIGWAKPVPYNPYNVRHGKWGEGIVALAGPLSNFVLAGVFGLILRFAPIYFGLNQAFLNLAGYVILINLTLAVFNLVPIPPLDGSKVLFAILPYKFHWVLEFFERFGMILVLIFVIFFWQLVSPSIYNLFQLITGYPIS